MLAMRSRSLFTALFTSMLLCPPTFSQTLEDKPVSEKADTANIEENKPKETEKSQGAKDGGIQLEGIFDPGDGEGGGGGGGGGSGSGAPSANEDRLSLMQNRETLNPYSSNLLGDTFDNNTGGLSFRHTDISLPTNFGIPVQFGRRFTGPSPTTFDQQFTDWEIDIPYIKTVGIAHIATNNTRMTWENGGNNCTAPTDGEAIFSGTGSFEGSEYFSGHTLNAPGQGGGNLLWKVDGSYKWRTKSNWRFKCITNPYGPNQAFVAYSPSGLKYTFGHNISKTKGNLSNSSGSTPLRVLYIYVNKIEDRFGNVITYEYESVGGGRGGLKRIVSSDGQSLTLYRDLPYPKNLLVTRAIANGRTWQYKYGYASKLHEVIRPDGKKWQFNLATLGQAPSNPTSCTPNSSNSTGTPVSVSHPDGITGQFYLSQRLHGNVNVPRRQMWTGSNYVDYTKKCFQSVALIKKTLTGAGVPTTNWHYSYSQSPGVYTGQTASSLNGNYPTVNLSRFHHKTTTVTHPDNTKNVYYINRDYSSALDGEVIASVKLNASNTTKSVSKSTLVQGPHQGFSGLEDANRKPAEYPLNLTQKVVSIYNSGGVDTYTTQYNTFDAYGFAKNTIASNSFNGKTKYTRQSYFHDTTNWLLGLPTTTEVSSNGTTFTQVARSTYHSAAGGYKSLPNYQYSFGRWTTRNESYHTSGSQKGQARLVRYNGNQRWMEYSNYKRGTPQTIRTPKSLSTASQYAYRVVNNNGWITKETDFLGQCINYGHDSLGRVSSISHCDSYWLPTSISYTLTTGSEGITGVASGMLKKTTATGNFRNIVYFDDMFRTVASKTWDTTAPADTVYTRNSYNLMNQTTFSSLPTSSGTSTYGATFQFDGLGRSTVVDNNTTAGTVSTTYLNQNRVRVNNNRGFNTTTTYLAYGSPSQGMATTIASPESVTTTMNYNIFGNILSVSQGGQTEYRVYDSYQALCKVVRNDVGNTAYSHDALGQLTWQASGSSVHSSTSSCDTSVSAADKISYAYDYLGNVKAVNYGDSSPDKTLAYDGNSRLITLTAGSVVNRYSYNSRNLITSESLEIDGLNFVLNQSFNNYGYLASTSYPSGTTVSYSPNALGQARQAGSYATGAVYHPNGMVKQHSYLGGTVHQSVQYSSGLPQYHHDIKNGQFVFGHRFVYDANNNVTYLDDRLNNAYDMQMTFDGLDRLNLITDSYSGTGDVNYDTLGNITYYRIGNKTINYAYNSSKQLTSTSGGATNSFSYDSKGNVTNNGRRGFSYNSASQMVNSSGLLYTYDGNGKRVKSNINGTKTYAYYGSNGKLMFNYKSGIYTDYIFLGGKLVGSKKGGTISLKHTDYLGSTVGVSSSSGVVQERMHYQPFGESIEPPKDDVGYTGHKFDTDLELNYMQARYYDPVIGRFYSNDPVGYTPQNPVMSFNRYMYVNNNPYKYNDPNGEFLNFAVKFVADVALNVAVQVATGQDVDIGGALLESAAGIVDPTKTFRKAKQLAKALKGKCCFVAGTQVLTENGYKNIEDVKLGEKLWAKNTETGEQDWKPVTKIFVEPGRGIYEIKLLGEDGLEQKIQATDDHPFYVIGAGWKDTIELEIGDLIETDGHGSMEVVSVIDEQRVDVTYNFTVADFHTYYVTEKNVLVHNCNKTRSTRPDADPAAEGRPHSIIEKPGAEGQYTTHNGDGTFKQYRGSGQDHGGIPRPNVKENKLNTNPETGEQFPGKAEVRPAREDEIPKG